MRAERIEQEARADAARHFDHPDGVPPCRRIRPFDGDPSLVWRERRVVIVGDIWQRRYLVAASVEPDEMAVGTGASIREHAARARRKRAAGTLRIVEHNSAGYRRRLAHDLGPVGVV